jgi:hypothetical protein
MSYGSDDADRVAAFEIEFTRRLDAASEAHGGACPPAPPPCRASIAGRSSLPNSRTRGGGPGGVIRRYEQFESHLDDIWPLLWSAAQRWGLPLHSSWRRLPWGVVFGLLYRTGRLPSDWRCELREVLIPPRITALALHTGITRRHLYRLRTAEVRGGRANPTTATYSKLVLAAGVGIPLQMGHLRPQRT